jgi:hypothetical protein
MGPKPPLAQAPPITERQMSLVYAKKSHHDHNGSHRPDAHNSNTPLLGWRP